MCPFFEVVKTPTYWQFKHLETPRRSVTVSPTRSSPNRTSNFSHSISELIRSVDYEASTSSILDAIPEREWRLLAALARKREEDDERERLADEFRKMWLKEKEDREMVEAETANQYKRYIHGKREQERMWNEQRRLQKNLEQQLRKGQLMDCIRHKERKSADLLAWMDDKKATRLVGQAIEEEARAILAADRRSRLGMAMEFQKRAELAHAQRRVDEARKRRCAILRDASQRAAISNALNSWESSLARREACALECARRAAHAARASLAAARAERLARARGRRERRARSGAALARALRDAVRGGRG